MLRHWKTPKSVTESIEEKYRKRKNNLIDDNKYVWYNKEYVTYKAILATFEVNLGNALCFKLHHVQLMFDVKTKRQVITLVSFPLFIQSLCLLNECRDSPNLV